MKTLTQYVLLQLILYTAWSLSQSTVNDTSISDFGNDEIYEYFQYEDNNLNFTDLVEEEDLKKSKRDRFSKDRPTKCKRRNGKEIEPGPPHFDTKKLSDSSGSNLGYEHELSCPHFSCPPATVTWFKDGRLMVPRKYMMGQSRVSFKKNGKLVITRNRRDDDGEYTCRVENQFGFINHTIQVKSVEASNQPPKIKEELTNATVLVGSNHTLTCEPFTRDNVFPKEITWHRHYKVNGSYFNEEQKAYDVELQTLHGTELELWNLQVNDSSYYSCMIKNHFGETISSAYIDVVESLDTPPSSSYSALLFVALGAVLLCSVLCSVYYCTKSKRSEKDKQLALENARTVAAWTKQVIISRQLEDDLLQPLVSIQKVWMEGNGKDNSSPVSEYEFPEDPDWEFPRNLLTIHTVLGEGFFGKVMLATARAEIRNGHLYAENTKDMCTDEQGARLSVAVKTVKEGHTDSDIIDLVKEMEIMKVIGRHPNIINLLGVCCQPAGAPLLVIVEYAQYGNLKEFLKLRKPGTQDHLKEQRQRRAAENGLNSNQYLLLKGSDQSLANPLLDGGEIGPVSLKLMLSFALQVAKGMEFLSARRCVHRDLAARNVLVADNFVLKIADFGMARDLQDSEYYRKESEGRLPIKWMAPESLFHRISTTMSDVWSFGILFWEIVTFGDTPYRDDFLPKVFMELIKNGYKMKQPLGCPERVYSLMRKCWAYQAEDRPCWSELVSSLYSHYTDTDPDEYLDLNVPDLETPPSSPEFRTRIRETEPQAHASCMYVLQDSKPTSQPQQIFNPPQLISCCLSSPKPTSQPQKAFNPPKPMSRCLSSPKPTSQPQQTFNPPQPIRSYLSSSKQFERSLSSPDSTGSPLLTKPRPEFYSQPLRSRRARPQYIQVFSDEEKEDCDVFYQTTPLIDTYKIKCELPTRVQDMCKNPTSLPEMCTNPTSLPDIFENSTSLQDMCTNPTSLPYTFTNPTSLPNTGKNNQIYQNSSQTSFLGRPQENRRNIHPEKSRRCDLRLDLLPTRGCKPSTPQVLPTSPEDQSLVYTTIRPPRSPAVVFRPAECWENPEDACPRFTSFKPEKKRGSSESGYGTGRESESSETRYTVGGVDRIRYASESDSVFLRNTPSPQSDPCPQST